MAISMEMEVKQVEKVATLIFPNTTICVQLFAKSLVQKGFVSEIVIREKNETKRKSFFFLEAEIEWIRKKHNSLIDFYVFLGGIIIN